MAKKFPLSGMISKITAKLSGSQQQGQANMQASRPDTPDLKILFFIVDWNRAHFITDVFEEEQVRFYFVSKGKGTARSEVLDLLGVGAADKAVMTCLEQAVLVPVILKEVRRKLGFHSPGAGIAFTIPLSAINDPVLLVFKQSIHKNQKIAEELNHRSANGGENMSNELTHDLIVSIVNHGYSDELMNTAREAGATGGTVLNARGQAHEGAVKFFGISVQDEKELIIILTSREKKVAIMKAICDSHGLNSKAQGIVFSLPVDNVMGLNFE